MSWTANSYFVTVAILFLWRVQEIAEACSCSPAHPQQAFCNSDVGKCQRWVPQKGSIFLLVPSVSVAVIPEKKKERSENAERGKSCPTLCVYSYKGEVSEEGVRRVEFSVSLSLFLHFPLLLRLCLLAPIVFPVWQMFWSSFFYWNIWNDFPQTRGRRIENRFWLCPFLLFLS